LPAKTWANSSEAQTDGSRPSSSATSGDQASVRGAATGSGGTLLYAAP
jgi:hypothetical protein